MILSCPACHTRYVVPESAVGSAGRQVRCANCKHSWHQDPAAPADAQAAPVADPAPEPKATPAPEPVIEEPAVYEAYQGEEAEEPKSGIGRWILFAALVLAAAVAAAWYLGMLDFGQARANAAPLQLEYPRQPERSTLESGNELLKVYGRIVNTSDAVQRVPQIRAELRDATGRIVHTFSISAPVAELGPDESATFDVAEMEVPRSARDLYLNFGPGV